MEIWRAFELDSYLQGTDADLLGRGAATDTAGVKGAGSEEGTLGRGVGVAVGGGVCWGAKEWGREGVELELIIGEEESSVVSKLLLVTAFLETVGNREESKLDMMDRRNILL